MTFDLLYYLHLYADIYGLDINYLVSEANLWKPLGNFFLYFTHLSPEGIG